MKLRGAIVILISFLFLFEACKQKAIEPNRPLEDKQKDRLIEANRDQIKQDAYLISAYNKRKNWNLIETESGLWFGIYKHGKGKKASGGKHVTIKYSLSLLDGTMCYSSDSLGSKQFVIGIGSVEAGLDEGVHKMQVGDAARLIVPPHLGLGLLGDGKCIPPRGILVYDVELTDVQQ